MEEFILLQQCIEDLSSPHLCIYSCINFKMFIGVYIRLLYVLEMTSVAAEKMAQLGKFRSLETTSEPAAAALECSPHALREMEGARAGRR